MVIYPAVAGIFYPEDPTELQAMLKLFFDNAADKANLETPKAIIAPHAGYSYSGPIAASAYACLQKSVNPIKRVIVLGLAHRYPLRGIAITKANYYQTPLGQIKIDQEYLDPILTMPSIATIEEAFLTEHSLEVQLPFLQYVLPDFTLVPFLIGYASEDEVASLLESLWDGPETLIIVSSDLSHYKSYTAANKIDAETANLIVNLKPNLIQPDNACGLIGVKGLLKVAKTRGLIGSCVDLRNSGDTAGDKSSVVGYGAFHFIEK